MKYNVKDSGNRQSFKSGAVRDIQTGKGRYDLISPIALERLARHYESGGLKYGDNNWQKGIPIKRILDSAMRHLNKYLKGDRSEDHIIACAWNCFAIAHTEDMIINGIMDTDLTKDLTCYIPQDSMDKNTKEWWNNIKKPKQKIKK